MPNLSPMGTVEFYAQYSGAIGSEIAMFMMTNWQMFIPGFGMFGFFDTQWYSTISMQGALDETLQGDHLNFNLFERAMLGLVDNTIGIDRLNEVKYGNVWLDNLAIAGLIATEITGYIDPTPISDSINAALWTAEGDYLNASISAAGALIPGGGEKALKAGARVGANAMQGMARAGSRVAREFSCAGATRPGRWMGKNIFGTACFTAGHWIVVLDDERLAAMAAVSGETLTEEPTSESGVALWTWQSASVAGAVALVGIGLVVQEADYRRRKRQLDQDLLDECFAEWDNQDDDDLPLPSTEPDGEDSESSTWDDALMDVAFERSDEAGFEPAGSDRGHGVALLARPRDLSREAAPVSSPVRQGGVTSALIVPKVRRTGTKRPRQAKRRRLWLGLTSLLAAALLAFTLPWSGWFSAPSAIEADGELLALDLEDAALDPTDAEAAFLDELDSLFTEKRIEEIQPGDIVLAMNVETGELEPREVLDAFSRISDHLRLLDFQTQAGEVQRLETTDEHPFWLPARNAYVNAADLTLGDEVRSPDGQRQRLVATNREPHPEGVAVFNFEVEGQHNYFVSSPQRTGAAVLVHNNDCVKNTATHSQKLARSLRANGIPRPSKAHQAAHIVPTNSFKKRPADVRKAVRTAQSKVNKHLGEKRRDTYINGFWAEAGHLGTHSNKFLLALGETFENINSKRGALGALSRLWKRIKAGEFVK
jgi:hypothetical protein